MGGGFILAKDQTIPRRIPELILHMPKGLQPFWNFVEEILGHCFRLRLSLGITERRRESSVGFGPSRK
jgi:hypothetical protein